MKIALILMMCSIPAFGQASSAEGFHLWSRVELEKMSNDLAPQMDQHLFKSLTLANAGNHRFLVSHREGVGEAEFHERDSDIMFVQSGHAKLTYGGKMLAARTAAAGELRGSGIEGGQERILNAGDVVVIPPKMPHQIVADGKEPFNYFVVKVTELDQVEVNSNANR